MIYPNKYSLLDIPKCFLHIQDGGRPPSSKKEYLLYLNNRLTDFDDLYFIWHVSMQGCAFWYWYCTTFWESNAPPQKHFRGAKRHFKVKMQNSQTFMLSKLLQWFEPNVAQWWTPSPHFWSFQNVPYKYRIVDGHHLEKKTINCYISKMVWPIMVKFCILGLRSIGVIAMCKFFKIQDGRWTPFWKNLICYVCNQMIDFNEIWYDNAY